MEARSAAIRGPAPPTDRLTPHCGAARLHAGYDSQLERLEGRGMEQLLDLHQPRRQPLPMVMAQEGFERLAVRLDSVGPEIVTHQVARFLQPLLDEWQRHLGGRSIAQ